MKLKVEKQQKKINEKRAAFFEKINPLTNLSKTNRREKTNYQYQE